MLIALAALAFAGVSVVPAPPLVNGNPGVVRIVVDPPTKAKATTIDARVMQTGVEGGILVVQLVPGHAGVLRIDVKTPDEAVTVEVPVIEPPRPPELTITPAEVKSGGTTTLEIRAPSASGQDEGQRRFQIAVSGGSVGPVKYADGVFTATYTAPKGNSEAVIVVADAAAPALSAHGTVKIGSGGASGLVIAPTPATVPVSAAVPLEVWGGDAEVTATCGTVTRTTAWSWTAPDAAASCVVTAKAGEIKAERTFAVVPAGSAAQGAPARVEIVEEGSGVRVAVLDSLGLPIANAAIDVTAPIGSVTPTARTDASGYARIPVTRGEHGQALVQVRASGLVGGFALGGAPIMAVSDAGGDRFRIAALLTNSHGGLHQTGEGATVVSDADTGSSAIGFWGATAELDWLPVRSRLGDIGVDGSASAALELYGLDSKTRVVVGRDWRAGFVLRRPATGAVEWRYGLGVAQPGAIYFGYADETLQDLRARAFARTGVRIAAGGEIQTEHVLWRFEGAETFAMAPARTELLGRADVDTSMLPMPLRFGLDAAYTGMRHRDDADAIAKAREWSVVLSVGVAFDR